MSLKGDASPSVLGWGFVASYNPPGSVFRSTVFTSLHRQHHLALLEICKILATHPGAFVERAPGIWIANPASRQQSGWELFSHHSAASSHSTVSPGSAAQVAHRTTAYYEGEHGHFRLGPSPYFLTIFISKGLHSGKGIEYLLCNNSQDPALLKEGHREYICFLGLL